MPSSGKVLSFSQQRVRLWRAGISSCRSEDLPASPEVRGLDCWVSQWGSLVASRQPRLSRLPLLGRPQGHSELPTPLFLAACLPRAKGQRGWCAASGLHLPAHLPAGSNAQSEPWCCQSQCRARRPLPAPNMARTARVPWARDRSPALPNVGPITFSHVRISQTGLAPKSLDETLQLCVVTPHRRGSGTANILWSGLRPWSPEGLCLPSSP